MVGYSSSDIGRGDREMGSEKTEEDPQMVERTEEEPILYVNGVRKVLPSGLAHLTLLEYLRGN